MLKTPFDERFFLCFAGSAEKLVVRRIFILAIGGELD
jgi:hypothetical protein